MLKHRIILPLSIAVTLLVNPGCKSRESAESGGSRVASADDYPVGQPLTTMELHKYLKDRLALQSAKATVDDGSNPADDIWDFYIDHVVTNKLWALELRNSRDMFGVPLTSLRFPTGTPLPDPCPEVNKLDVGGKPACLAMDNLMRYMWEPKAKAQVKQDAKDWFVHLIPQFFGSKQPAMQKFIREGDIIVYFHPESRPDNPSSVVQWRTSHAATIIKRESDGALMTVDTPSGYAQPFNGMDTTPFHVYRLVPRDFQDWNVADEYGKQVARWGTLAFDKFDFQGNYGVMAGHMKRETDIDKFVDGYLSSASSTTEVLPPMYCAWYTWTNLNLAWMRPMTPSGLGKDQFNKLAGTTFSNLRPNHNYQQGNFDKGYAVPPAIQGRMTKRNNFAVMPMTAPELMLGFLDRMIGRTTDATTPAQFIALAKMKAAMLTAFADPNNGVISTFQIEPRTLQAGDTRTPQDDYNDEVQKTFLKFADKFETLSQSIATGAIDVAGAQKEVNETFLKIVKEEWTKNIDVSRKWIPPYGFMHHAEYGYEKYNVQDKAQPVLAYVGTVFHEKFLRKKGEAAGAKKMSMVGDTVAKTEDTDLDADIYAKLGCPASTDGNGWKALLSHIDPASTTPECGVANPAIQKMTVPEFKAVKQMIDNWEVGGTPTERQIYVRNTFGLDPVLSRRLLVSYWNDPTQFFKPAIYEGAASTVDSAVVNLRILLGAQTMTLNPAPADVALYTTAGHPRRTTPVPCIAFASPNIANCARGPWVQAFAN